MFPDRFVSVHLLEAIRWPGPLTELPYIIMGAFTLFGVVLAVALAAPHLVFWSQLLPRVRAVRHASAPVEPPPDAVALRGRELLFFAAGGVALAFALTTLHVIVPEVSKHLSARELYGKTKLLDPNAPVGQYRFNATGAAYYSGGTPPTTLNTLDELFTFLGKPERVFAMVGAPELASIDQAAREKKIDYHVVDDSNSRYLILSNQLKPGETDVNPLKLFISETPPKPKFPVEANFEDKIQLLGYDLPDRLARGQDFKIRLYFKVLAPVGGSYKVFVHFDGPGTRFNGDHVPLEERFPTPNWVPGYYITDEHLMRPDRATQPAGAYRIFMGFFAGATRLKVTAGPQDGDNRVRLGAVVIQ